ncbi:MAG: sulfite exporter TauE/SafE family protein [Fimbriimonadaceae bacterium]|nr:sulfite exporter TauE/SafE family protein [Fimbriimonadaceae bacterium]
MPLYETPTGLVLAFLGGVLAAAVNAFAGGGTLVSFPLLVFAGMPELHANATNSVGLWPGSLSSALGYRESLPRVRPVLFRLVAPTLVGALAGSLLLVATPSSTFKAAVPWLILSATVLLALQDKVKAWSERTGHGRHPASGAVIQTLISVYGGYFGAGMGIMMLGAMVLFMDADLNEMNAVKNWLAVLINLAAMGIFLGKGLIALGPCLSMMLGAILGGYASARITQKVHSGILRTIVVVYGVVMTGVFIARMLGGS